MTVSSTTTRIAYTGNGATTAFPVPFVFFGEDEVEVIERTIATGSETTKTLTTHYSVSGGNGSTGTVTAVSAPASTVEWHIRRRTARTQLVDYTPNDPFPAQTHERALDRAVAVAQEIEEVVSRSLALSPTSAAGAIVVPDPAASKFLRWNAGATGLENADVAASGTLALPVAVADGGTGGSTAAAARTNLGLVIASQAEVDAAAAARLVEADKLAASPGYGRGFRNAAGRNGGLEVWQRGAGGAASIAVAASTTAYTADGWALKTNANQASTVAQVAGIASGSRWAARVRRNASETGTGVMAFELPLDADEIALLRGSRVTLSLWLAAGANWSPASGNLTIELRTGTGSPAKRSAGAYTGEAADISQAQAITTTPTRYSFTSAAAVGAAVTQASIYLTWTPAGTAGAADDFTIDDVQLEIGPAATAFERLPFDIELQRCMRHFWKTFPYATAPAQNAGATGCVRFHHFIASAVATRTYALFFPVRLRASPTVTLYNPNAANGEVRNLTDAADCASSAASNVNEGSFQAIFTGNAAATSNDEYGVHATAEAGI